MVMEINSAITSQIAGKQGLAPANDTARSAGAATRAASRHDAASGVGSDADASRSSRVMRERSDGATLIQMTRQALSQMTVHLESIRGLAQRGGAGYSSTQVQVQQHISALQRIASETTFRGEAIVDGNKHSFQFDVGAVATHGLNVDVNVNIDRHPVNFDYIGGANIRNGVHLGSHGLTLQVGNHIITLLGDFKTGQELAAAINKANIGITASLTNKGQLKLHAFSPIVISGGGSKRGYVNIGGSETTISGPPLLRPLMETTVSAQVTVQHVDSMIVAFQAQQDRLDAAHDELLAALGNTPSAADNVNGATAHDTAGAIRSRIGQTPQAALSAQANASANKVWNTLG